MEVEEKDSFISVMSQEVTPESEFLPKKTGLARSPASLKAVKQFPIHKGEKSEEKPNDTSDLAKTKGKVADQLPKGLKTHYQTSCVGIQDKKEKSPEPQVKQEPKPPDSLTKTRPLEPFAKQQQTISIKSSEHLVPFCSTIKSFGAIKEKLESSLAIHSPKPISFMNSSQCSPQKHSDKPVDHPKLVRPASSIFSSRLSAPFDNNTQTGDAKPPTNLKISSPKSQKGGLSARSNSARPKEIEINQQILSKINEQKKKLQNQPISSRLNLKLNDKSRSRSPQFTKTQESANVTNEDLKETSRKIKFSIGKSPSSPKITSQSLSPQILMMMSERNGSLSARDYIYGNEE